MDLKTRLNSSQQENSEKKGDFKANSMGFLQGVKEEIKRISWTDKKELFFFTKLVVIATFVFGMSVYVIDLIFKNALDFISHVFRSLFG